MTFRDHFSRQAETYRRFRPKYPETLFTWLNEEAPAHNLALDVATGNGQAAVALAGTFKQVIATDASADQLAHAQAHDRITYRKAPAENSGLAADSVDLLTVATALHWFDHPRFFEEARRVLRPGGLLAAWSYSWSEYEAPEIVPVIRRYAREVLEGFWPEQVRISWNGYRDLTFPFPPIECPRFEVQVARDMASMFGYLRSWSASQRYVEAKGCDPIDEIREEMTEAWGDPHREISVCMPLFLWAGRKA